MCLSLTDEYRAVIQETDGLGVIGSLEGLKESSVFFQEHKNDCITGSTMKSIMKELTKTLPKELEISPHGSIFIRYDEESPQFLRAVLTGIESTPYSSGLFVFDLYCPPDYPNIPLLCTHTTKNATSVHANNGPGGFSPNLHSHSGKVCLSLLGTWEGPGWKAGESNIYQVLSSILFMILGAPHPYYMEPGFGGWEGTVGPFEDDPDREQVVEYDEEVKRWNAQLCLLDPLVNPIPGFEAVCARHLMTKRRVITATLQAWIDKGSAQLRAHLQPILRELLEAFRSRMSQAEIAEELRLAEEALEFLQRFALFLEEKVRANEPAAATKVPKAVARLARVPDALAEAAEAVHAARAALVAKGSAGIADAKACSYGSQLEGVRGGVGGGVGGEEGAEEIMDAGAFSAEEKGLEADSDSFPLTSGGGGPEDLASSL